MSPRGWKADTKSGLERLLRLGAQLALAMQLRLAQGNQRSCLTSMKAVA